jgi:hypothetical protein
MKLPTMKEVEESIAKAPVLRAIQHATRLLVEDLQRLERPEDEGTLYAQQWAALQPHLSRPYGIHLHTHNTPTAREVAEAYLEYFTLAELHSAIRATLAPKVEAPSGQKRDLEIAARRRGSQFALTESGEQKPLAVLEPCTSTLQTPIKGTK